MKKKLIAATMVLFAACNQPSKELVTDIQPAANTSFDEDKEKAAIMKVIEGETECFFQRDYECWRKHFVQSDYAFQAWNNSDGSIDTKSGWKEVDEKIKAYISAPENKPDSKKSMGQEPGIKAKPSSHPKVIRKNIVYKFFTESLVYMMWDQYNSDPDELRYTFSKDCRIMEKVKGEWKIVNVTSYWDYKKSIPAESIK